MPPRSFKLLASYQHGITKHMNNKEFIARLAAKTGHTQDDTQKLVRTVVRTLADNFDDGEAVSISGFGTFEVKKRLERIMVNPTTGKRMLIPPKLALTFRPNAAVKEKIKKGGEA